jgi:hypothetical protein
MTTFKEIKIYEINICIDFYPCLPPWLVGRASVSHGHNLVQHILRDA